LFIVVVLASEGGESNIISPDGSLVFILALFLILVYLLNRTLFKPIGNILDERENLTEGARSEARAAARRCQELMAQYEAGIRRARAEGYSRIERARQQALQWRTRLIEETKREAEREIQKARTNIASQAELARRALKEEAHNLALRISRAVLGRQVGGD
jgi:F-type H+-transporting ATPase subunit b